MNEYYYDIIVSRNFDNEGLDSTELISFRLYDDFGNIDIQSQNPITGFWGHNFRQGWSEQDPALNKLLSVINDVSESDEIVDLITSLDDDNIGNIYELKINDYENYDIKVQLTGMEAEPN